MVDEVQPRANNRSLFMLSLMCVCKKSLSSFWVKASQTKWKEKRKRGAQQWLFIGPDM
jgi:hypothetical protein